MTKSNSLQIPFAKMSGAGNDFILIDCRDQANDKKFLGISRRDVASRLCRRAISVGADGLIFLDRDPASDVCWDFYNSDGSTAEMCGNAIRCVALYMKNKGFSGDEIKIKTPVGVVKARIEGPNKVKATMLLPKLLDKSPVLVDSGVPHVVFREASLADLNVLRPKAKQHRHSARAGPRGANVTFFEEVSVGHINSVTFERGVEEFTLACGTGALASAFTVHLETPAVTSVEVRMPGGRLHVEFPANSHIVNLTGPARFIYEGFLTEDALNEEI